MSDSSSDSSWTLITAVLAILSILMLGVVFLIISAQGGSGPAYQMKNTTQVRGIMQGLVVYGDGNKEFYPGLDSKGKIEDVTVEHRFWLLLDNNSFSGEYLISPLETMKTWTTGPLTSSQYSYSLLQLNESNTKPKTGRISEWRQTINTEAIVISDRNTGSDTDANVESIHSATPGVWHGSIGRNDGSASFENTHLLDTRYGPKGTPNPGDNLFEAAGDDDAYMIHTGN